jgi:glycosyltransferase involved in cell wall biosynthesis
MTVPMNGFLLKRSSPGSKGLVCLRFEGKRGETYPRDLLLHLKRQWYFFWFSSWNHTLRDIPYADLIDIFVGWDELLREIRMKKRTDCVLLRGGCETFERHDSLFFPLEKTERDIDIIYIARFIRYKRCDIAIKCVQYLVERNPSCRALFLESVASEPDVHDWVHNERAQLGLERNLTISTVPIAAVNSYLNRARLSLFTSDEEGICRAVLQSLLAERPLLCFRHTKALTRQFFDDRYFNYYDYQTEQSVGGAAYTLLAQAPDCNSGSREYLLRERSLKFYNLVEWQANICRAAEPLYARDGQELNWADVVPPRDLTLGQAWMEFKLAPQ